jgi:hypothetical protein
MEAMELKELADEHDLADPGHEFEDIDDAREYVCERLGLEAGDDEDDDEEEEEKKHKQDEDDEDEDDEDENDEAIQRLRQKPPRLSAALPTRTHNDLMINPEQGREQVASPRGCDSNSGVINIISCGQLPPRAPVARSLSYERMPIGMSPPPHSAGAAID